jgi:hypothetical protein
MKLIAVLSLILLAGAARAAGGFESKQIEEPVSESNPVIRTYVADGPIQISFVALRNWPFRAIESEKRLVMESNPPGAWISVQFSTNSAPAASALKELISRRYSGAVLDEAFKAPSGSGTGVGIEFNYEGPGNYPFKARTAIYAAPSGSIEITLLSRPEHFEQFHGAWTAFINSFRIESLARPRLPR